MKGEQQKRKVKHWKFKLRYLCSETTEQTPSILHTNNPWEGAILIVQVVVPSKLMAK